MGSDIIGQYYDLLHLLSIGGSASTKKYLFLGGYVGHFLDTASWGRFGIECVLLLYAMKIKYPKSVFMLRGNMEYRRMTKIYKFQDECLAKYNARVWEACMESFDALPLAAIVDKQFFCVHGGLSPRIRRVSEIQEVDRFREPRDSEEGDVMLDLLWSDPIPSYGTTSYGRSSGDHVQRYTFKTNRRVIYYNFYYFTYHAVCEFLRNNDLLYVIRGTQAENAGYKLYKNYRGNFPSVITIDSAPNFDDDKGAILCYESGNMTLKTFQSQPHPYWLPNFQNGLEYSLPLVVEQATQFIQVLLNVCSEEELNEASDTPLPDNDREDDSREYVDSGEFSSQITVNEKKPKSRKRKSSALPMIQPSSRKIKLRVEDDFIQIARLR